MQVILTTNYNYKKNKLFGLIKTHFLELITLAFYGTLPVCYACGQIIWFADAKLSPYLLNMTTRLFFSVR